MKFRSFIDIFEYGRAHYPEKTAIILGDQQRRYGEIFEQGKRIAGFLKQQGIQKQDKVAIISQNSIDYVETVLGIIMAGGVAVNINWRLAVPELHHLLHFNDVKLTFFRSKDTAIREEMGNLTRELCNGVDMDQSETWLQGISPLEKYEERGEEDIFMHLHTSGTTGVPKTVRYTYGRYMQELNSSVQSLRFDEHTVFQIMSQMFHSASIGPYAILACGGTVVMFSKFNPVEYLKSVSKHHVTRLSAIPTVLTALLALPDFEQYDLRSVQTISYSTCPMPEALLRKAMEHIHCQFQQSYGMTEMGSIVTILSEEDHLRDNMKYLSSVGLPTAGHEIRIVKENGEECAPGESGEIIVRGPGMMLDYYKMPKETKEAIRDGWYHTKDVGYLDPDGYLFLNGRKSDMIISGGENIFPREIESVIRENHLVRDVYVCGAPDEYWGEAVQAFVILQKDGSVTEQELKSFLRGKIAGYKIPKKIYFCQDFPKTATGKVCKRDLLDWAKRP